MTPISPHPAAAPLSAHITVRGVELGWPGNGGPCQVGPQPVVMMGVDSTLTSLMAAASSLVGPARLALTLQTEARQRVDAAWQLFEGHPSFEAGFDAWRPVAAVAGWGDWHLVEFDSAHPRCVFRIFNHWEGQVQQALGHQGGSALLAGLLSGLCGRHFGVPCWALQTRFAVRGDACDEFVVGPSPTEVEDEIERQRTQGADQPLDLARALNEARAASEANAAKNDFLSRMSHELRTPLNAVLGFAQLLRMDVAQHLTPAQRTQVDRIEQAGEHLLALVSDMLDVSAIEAGRVQLALQAVPVADLIEQALSLVSVPAGDGDLVVGGNWRAQTGVQVRADRVRLRQVLINLLTNAVKFSRPAGQVAVTVQTQPDGRVQIVVQDTGRGMSAAQQAHLFEPFNRVGAEHSRVEGTGIGLVISKGLLAGMDGQLSVASQLGQGTQVTVSLPAQGGACEPAGRWVVPSATSGLRPLHVVYAEDDEVNAELMRQVLAMQPGIRLDVAATGWQALQQARQQAPDLMLVDMLLGDMTGLELARLLRADTRTRGIRLVGLSAEAKPAHIALALAQGFEHYLTKPVDFTALLRLLDDCRR